ncbi:hypothetical protein Hanom_Chr10g00953251 [Helianthus anomalus]
MFSQPDGRAMLAEVREEVEQTVVEVEEECCFDVVPKNSNSSLADEVYNNFVGLFNGSMEFNMEESEEEKVMKENQMMAAQIVEEDGKNSESESKFDIIPCEVYAENEEFFKQKCTVLEKKEDFSKQNLCRRCSKRRISGTNMQGSN